MCVTACMSVCKRHFTVILLVCVLLEYFTYRFRVVPVVQYATTHPVQQLDDNSEQVMADRQLTLDNIIHQADQVLRKCVSKKITASKGT